MPNTKQNTPETTPARQREIELTPEADAEESGEVEESEEDSDAEESESEESSEVRRDRFTWEERDIKWLN